MGEKVCWQYVAFFCLVLVEWNCFEDHFREVDSPPIYLTESWTIYPGLDLRVFEFGV